MSEKLYIFPLNGQQHIVYRDKKAAKRFLKKALGSKHNQIPRAITVDKNPAYPSAVNELKNDRILPKKVSLRQIKYLNNIVEQIIDL